MATDKQSKAADKDKLSDEAYKRMVDANKNYTPWAWRLGQASQKGK